MSVQNKKTSDRFTGPLMIVSGLVFFVGVLVLMIDKGFAALNYACTLVVVAMVVSLVGIYTRHKYEQSQRPRKTLDRRGPKRQD